MTTPDLSVQVRPRQKGTALVIALVFLMLMTVLGLASMRGSALQERMAGNLRDRNLAFQAAEAALRSGEAWLDDAANAKAAETIDRLTAPAAWDGTLPTDAAVLDDEDVQLSELDGQLRAAPVFHVAAPRLALTDPADPASPIRSLYPVTAYAVGGSDTAIVILQSYCERPCRP